MPLVMTKKQQWILFVGILIFGLLITHMIKEYQTGSSIHRPNPTLVPLDRDLSNEHPILDVPAGYLLAPLTIFPEQWKSDDLCKDGCIDATVRAASRSFFPPIHQGKAMNDILRFTTSQKALDYLAHLQQVYQLGPIQSLTYRSSYADNELMQCDEKHAVTACRVVTRYRNFVSVWYFRVDPNDDQEIDGLVLDQIEPILRGSDQHIASVLQLRPYSCPDCTPMSRPIVPPTPTVNPNHMPLK